MFPKLLIFRKDRRGGVAVLFALLILPILGIVFLALDTMQGSMFRGTLQTVAERAARAGSSIKEESGVSQRREVTKTALRQLLLEARLRPEDVGARIEFSERAGGANIATTVTLEAKRTPLIAFANAGLSTVRVTAKNDASHVSGLERQMKCQIVPTQAEFDALGC